LILAFAGFLMSRGELRVVPTLIAATLGSLLRAFVIYALGRWGGRGLALRYRSVLRLKEADLERAERWFDRYDEAAVFFGRMVQGLRSVVSIPGDAPVAARAISAAHRHGRPALGRGALMPRLVPRLQLAASDRHCGIDLQRCPGGGARRLGWPGDLVVA
jgi:SNARE associated Golgi protein